jgi:succinate-semialdehyde dehydrogenase / glutarate-semialdehyde dehydrogenase
MSLVSINPATGDRLEEYQELDDAALEEKIVRAAIAAARHRTTTFAERAVCMSRAAAALDADKQRLARLMVAEMGKPIAAAVAEVEKCAWACRHYAENAAAYLADESVATERKTFVRHLPLGPVLAIMPWNFPFWQVFRFAAPALMAGNVGLLKHASNVPGCALAIEEIFARAGFAEGVFQTLLIGSARAGRVVEDPRIAAVTLTGSDLAGEKVAEAAGRRLKKTVLELGGSDPFIVLPSADLAAAAKTAVTARLINNGQSCIAAKRFIVHQAVYDEFVSRFVAGLGAARMGDPMLPETDLGPLATAAGQDALAAQVERSLAVGARALIGGVRPRGRGFFYPATALADIPREAPVYHEEVFGPVALLYRARDLDHAIALANDSPFGLASSVWTRDAAEQHRLIDEIEAGSTFVNSMVVSDPRLPFGGVKRSGYGRELGGWGIKEFVNIKTVSIQD